MTGHGLLGAGPVTGIRCKVLAHPQLQEGIMQGGVQTLQPRLCVPGVLFAHPALRPSYPPRRTFFTRNGLAIPTRHYVRTTA